MKNNLLNSTSQYGWISIVLHWSMALVLIGMFFLGDYMVELNYYDTWYHKAPAIHKATGIILGMFLMFRIGWNYAQSRPVSLEKSVTLTVLAKLGHLSIYLIIIVLCISGYFISTAKGQGIDVFYLFELPALLADSADRGEAAGKVHDIAGSLFILIIVLHAIAGLVHHFAFKDRTLKRILWVKKPPESIL
ncbi:Cytochrome B561 [hydrothermal vent metagenome]|uniref:Cytochrome B561 n=1 Tax=hydrothermal vent metagenome TaxID=652676 RepID=A0A3B0WL65_9ZZZZ